MAIMCGYNNFSKFQMIIIAQVTVIYGIVSFGVHVVSTSSTENATETEWPRHKTQQEVFRRDEKNLSDFKEFLTSPTSGQSPALKFKCSRLDAASLSQCLQQVLVDLKPHLSQGLSDINLPPMEPFALQNTTFSQGTGPVQVTSGFTNVTVSGLSNFSEPRFWADVTKRRLDFDMMFPRLWLTGNYELSGNIFFVMIGGKGDFFLDLEGTRAQGSCQLELLKNGSSSHFTVRKTNVNLSIGKIKIHLTNLFNGDPVLGTFMNRFLSENAHDIFEEVRPQVESQLGEMMTALATRVFSSVSSTAIFDADV